MMAVTWAVSLGCTAGNVFGSNDTSHPVGAVPASWTLASAAVPVLETIIGTRFSLLAVPYVFSFWSAVCSASFGDPLTSAVSSIFPDAPLAADTATSIGYLSSGVPAGGVASTLTVLLPPASIVIVWAFAWALGDAVTVQPCGPVGSN